MRVKILVQIAHEGKASPSMLARTFDKNLNVIAYHVGVLEKYGALELTETRPRRGATEHYYVVKKTSAAIKVLLGSRMAEKDPVPLKEFMSGMLEGRVDLGHVIPVQLDQSGAKEVSELLANLRESLHLVERASLKRLKESGSDPVLLTIGISAGA